MYQVLGSGEPLKRESNRLHLHNQFYVWNVEPSTCFFFQLERIAYEVVVEDGKFMFKVSGELLDTTEVDKHVKWIFVLSTSKALYVGKKQKGRFQHSSFLAGGATSAAGRLVVENGILKVQNHRAFRVPFFLSLLSSYYLNCLSIINHEIVRLTTILLLFIRQFGLIVVITVPRKKTLRNLSPSLQKTMSTSLM